MPTVADVADASPISAVAAVPAVASVAVFYSSAVSAVGGVVASDRCDQLVVGLTHARGGTFALLMTYVTDLVRVAVVAPIGNSDHSSLSAVI